MPTNLDLVGEGDDGLGLYRDDDYVLSMPVTFEGDVDAVLDDYTITAQIRDKPSHSSRSGRLLAEFTVGIAGSTVTLTLDHDTTTGLPDVAFWDLQTVVAGQRNTWFQGRVEVYGDVTRDEEDS